jgi:hypothetical protein
MEVIRSVPLAAASVRRRADSQFGYLPRGDAPEAKNGFNLA